MLSVKKIKYFKLSLFYSRNSQLRILINKECNSSILENSIWNVIDSDFVLRTHNGIVF